MGESEAEGEAGSALALAGGEWKVGGGEEVRKEKGKVRELGGGRAGSQDSSCLSMSLQVRSQSHLWRAQLQGSGGQVGLAPSLGRGRALLGHLLPRLSPC